MMENYIDLHIHTNHSDGEYSLKKTIDLIKKNKVSTFSITDHDNIESCNKLQQLILDGLTYFNGIEISSKFNNYNVHILGYNFDHDNIELKQLLNHINRLRRDRIINLVEFLYNEYQININEKDIYDMFEKNPTIGKAHVIKLLFQYGYGKDNKEIYKRYIKDWNSKINYRSSLEETIRVINTANGITVLAHPKEVEKEYCININDIIEELVKKGIQGIEVYNSLHNLNDIKRYLEIAKHYNLLISGGSDYHGPFVKPDVEIGKVCQEKRHIKTLSIVNSINRN